MNCKFEEHPDTGKVLNRLAREQMKFRLLADIQTDIMVCSLEGIDYKEYLQELKEIIDEFLRCKNGINKG